MAGCTWVDGNCAVPPGGRRFARLGRFACFYCVTDLLMLRVVPAGNPAQVLVEGLCAESATGAGMRVVERES